MALTDESNGNGFYMPVAPAYGGGYGNNGGGWGMGGDWWGILLLIALLNGGFGGFGGFGGGMMWPMMMGGMAGGFDLYPWLNNSQHISDGFRDQQITTYLNGLQNSITSGFGDVQLGIAGINQNICQTGNAITGAITNGQMANMQQIFGVQSALQNCCCENRAGLADLRYTVATEACADRAAVSDALRDVLAANTASTQRILDQLCQDKIDAKNDEIAQLRQEILFARGQASQIAQNQQVIDGIYNRLDTCPVGTTPVYGRTPIFSCNNGCGCSGNTGFVG